MKKQYLISTIFWLFFIVLIISMGDESIALNNKEHFPYYLSQYGSFLDLLFKLTEINYNKDLFVYCCDVINFCGRYFGYSYADMNLIIFVVAMPMFLINLIILLIIQHREIKRLQERS